MLNQELKPTRNAKNNLVAFPNASNQRTGREEIKSLTTAYLEQLTDGNIKHRTNLESIEYDATVAVLDVLDEYNVICPADECYSILEEARRDEEEVCEPFLSALEELMFNEFKKNPQRFIFRMFLYTFLSMLVLWACVPVLFKSV